LPSVKQIDQVVRHASAQRPDCTVIPAAVLTQSRVFGDELGLQTAGLSASGGSPGALVVLADTVELWSGEYEREPRWSMPRTGLQIDVDPVRAGIANNWDAVWLSDGLNRLAVSPRYSRSSNGPANDIDRVLRELGQDPAEVRRRSWPERRGSGRIDRRFVVPFYIRMSGAGAPYYLPKVQRALVRASTKVTGENVRWLLSTRDWRRTAMGAWFALAVPAEEVRAAVLAGMGEAPRDDSALPLATVSAMLAGPDSIGAMETYLDRIIDQPHRDQSFEIVAAAIAHLGGTPPAAPPAWAIETFEELLATAQDLQLTFRAARA
jgi:hypothetical protein